MMTWRDVEPEIEILDVRGLLGRFGAVDAAGLIVTSTREPLILITPSCQQAIWDYLKSSEKELGGLILGKVYALEYEVRHAYPYVSLITDCVRSYKHKNTAASLRMSAEIWSGSRSYFDEQKLVVGWFHSHPRLGAFFSGTDRATQRGFFAHPYSIGIVIDPSNGDSRCFCGRDSTEIPFRLRMASDSLL